MKRSVNDKKNRNTLKKAAAAVLCAALVLCTAACGGKSTQAEPSPSPSVTPSATPAPAEKVKTATVNAIDDSLNVRSEASTDSEILGTANAGDVFEVVAQDDTSEWVEISYFGQNAYVFAEFVTIGEKEKSALTAASATPTPSTEDGTDDTQGTAEPSSTPSAAPTAEPTPNAENPIIVNGGNRENTTTKSTSDGMTAESIRDTEDPERR